MRWVALLFVVAACIPSIEGAPCVTDDNCASGQICTEGDCGFGVRRSGSCDSTSQPGGCGYGSVCSSTNLCAPITEGACAHIANASSRTPWTSSATGPVIFNVVDEADGSTCTVGNAFTMTIHAYAGATPFPAQVSALPRLFSFNSAGVGVDITQLLLQPNYSVFNLNSQMSVKFSQCASEATQLTLGLAFVGGNGVCTTQTR